MIDIEDILDEIQIEEYISQYVDLEQDGDEYFGVCPFHNDSDPSFSVTPSRNVWYCFGCHRGGSVLTFAKAYHHMNTRQAIEHLKKYAGISDDCEDNVQVRRLNATREMKKYREPKNKKKRTYKILQSSIMQRYDDSSQKLQLWIDEGIGLDVMRKYQVKYDPFSNRIVFPIRLPTGQIINVCGRTLEEDWKTKKDINGKPIRKYTYFYDLGILDTLFGLYEHLDSIKSTGEIILYEGAKSVMLAETWGITNTAAVLTSKINPYQLKIILGLGVKVVFALDANVDVNKIPEVQKLQRFVTVEAVINRDNLLGPKEAPVDKGFDTWQYLYERRCRLNSPSTYTQ